MNHWITINNQPVLVLSMSGEYLLYQTLKGQQRRLRMKGLKYHDMDVLKQCVACSQILFRGCKLSRIGKHKGHRALCLLCTSTAIEQLNAREREVRRWLDL